MQHYSLYVKVYTMKWNTCHKVHKHLSGPAESGNESKPEWPRFHNASKSDSTPQPNYFETQSNTKSLCTFHGTIRGLKLTNSANISLTVRLSKFAGEGWSIIEHKLSAPRKWICKRYLSVGQANKSVFLRAPSVRKNTILGVVAKNRMSTETSRIALRQN